MLHTSDLKPGGLDLGEYFPEILEKNTDSVPGGLQEVPAREEIGLQGAILEVLGNDTGTPQVKKKRPQGFMGNRINPDGDFHPLRRVSVGGVHRHFPNLDAAFSMVHNKVVPAPTGRELIWKALWKKGEDGGRKVVRMGRGLPDIRPSGKRN
jgi:hypothetical protein